MRDQKKVKKKVKSAVASAGHAEGGKEGLDGWDRPDLARPWPRRAGRADCLRFASPAEATGGLELGDLELGGLQEACKRLRRGSEYLVGMVMGAKIS